MFHILIFWASFAIVVKTVPIRQGDIQSKPYLMNEDYFNDEKLTHGSLQSALLEFQKYNLFRGYGKLSVENPQGMKYPRCGLPIIPVASKVKWNKFDMNWCLNVPSRKLPVCEQRKTLALAFKIWSQSTIFQFNEVPCNKADIRFYFTWSYPGNGHRFDGQGSRQVYVSMSEAKPGTSQNVGIYFDEAEHWQTLDTQKASLLFASAHAIGHALGLGHSSDPHSVMVFNFYYPVAVLSTTDKISLQELYGESVVVKMATQEKTTGDPVTKESDFYDSTKSISEQWEELLYNIKTEQKTNLPLDFQITTTTSEYETSITKEISANYKDIRLAVYSDPKTESAEKLERDSKKLAIPNPKISLEAEKDSTSDFMKRIIEEDSVTNEVLDKDLAQKKMVSSFLLLSKRKPESKTEVRRTSSRDDGFKQHQLFKSDSNVKLKENMNYLTSQLPGIRPRDNKELARGQPKMIPNSKNQTLVDLLNRRTPQTSGESSGKEFDETLKLGSDQDNQQTSGSKTVEKLERKQNKDTLKWSEAERMPGRELKTQRMSTTSQKPEAIATKHIGKTKHGSTDVPNQKGETGINLRPEETKNKKQNAKNILVKSEPKTTEMVKRPYDDQESTSQRKSALAEHAKLEKLRKNLRLTKVEMPSLKLDNTSRKLPQSEKAVLKAFKTSTSEERTGVAELQQKEQRDKQGNLAGGIFTADQEALTNATTQRSSENEKNAHALHSEEISRQSGDIKTRLVGTHINGPTSEVVPTELKNSSKHLHTKFSLVKDNSVEISFKRRPRTIRRKLAKKQMTRDNLTLLEINATIFTYFNLTERLSPTNSLSGNHNTSVIYLHGEITPKRPCQCHTKIANCESILCKFIEKAFKVYCYFYVHICAFFTGSRINHFISISK